MQDGIKEVEKEEGRGEKEGEEGGGKSYILLTFRRCNFLTLECGKHPVFGRDRFN
jgi:hypothetical protein